MTDVKKFYKSNFMKDVIQKGKKKINLKFLAANKDTICNLKSSNLDLNNLNVKELSRLSDRPIHQKIEYKNERYNRYNIFSTDGTHQNSEHKVVLKNIKNENNINYNYNYNNYAPNCHKSVVIFADPPKRISDYILKDKSISKRKVYKLIFVEEEDEDRNRKPYVYNYLNSECCQNFKNADINFCNYNNLKKYNDLYYKNNSVGRRKKNETPINIKIQNPKDEKRSNNIIKIQTLWRGYRTRKIIKKKIKIIQASKIYRIISQSFNIIVKSYINIFLVKLKKIYNNSLIINRKLERQNLNKSKKIYMNKNKANNNFVYNKKNQTQGFYSSFNKRKPNNIQIHNIKQIPISKKNNYYIIKSKNPKNQNEKEISLIIKYIFKKNCFLHYPLLLYRLKILQRMNLFEHRYNCLCRIIKIKAKLILFQYFQKYKNIIKSESTKDRISNSDAKVFNNSIDKKDSQNKSELNDLKNRNSILNNIFNKIDAKTKKLLLEKYFNIWKNILSKEKIIFQNSRNKFNSNSNIIPKHESSASIKKKQIRIKKLKSNFNNSKIMSKSIGKNKANSFYSDNISVKKMKVHKINISVEPNDIKKEDFNNINAIIKKNSSDNSYFISKIRNVANKINIKNDMFRCFKLWKKLSNLK